jgi:3-hydroxyisobutyrate dehydrogenase
MTNVSWIGLGAMGAPMATCLAHAGHQVNAYDVDPARAPSLAGEGVKAAGSVVEAATGADVLVIMVAKPAQAEGVLFGDGQAVSAMQPGTVVLVMATVGPVAVTRWSQHLAAGWIDVVGAPVSGGVTRAGSGDLLAMVAGPAIAVEKVQPLLDALSSNAPVVGTNVGDGQKVKLVNQLLCGVHIVVAAEALAFAEALGLDAATCHEVLRHGAAASFMFEDRGRRMVEYAGPLASAAEQLYLAGHRAELGRHDDSSVVEVLRQPFGCLVDE